MTTPGGSVIRFALLVLLAACNGQNGDDTGDTDCTSDCDDDGFTTDDGDCNDNNADIHPDATEVWYDDIDQNCDGNDDDQDLDTFDAESEGGDDCNDTNAAIHPGATETYYDGVDTDCNGLSDNDADGDTYDDVGHGGNDCDDTKADVHPDADELCSTAYDDDCEGGANEADAVDAPTWYEDFDTDTFGNALETLVQCTKPDGYVADDTDCNDDAITVYPDADDVACDGFDNDCDPLTFEASAFEVNGAAGTGSLATAVGNAVDDDVITVCEGKHAVSDITISNRITFEGKGGPDLTILEPPVIDVDPTTATLMRGAPLLRVSTTDAVIIQNLSLTKSAGWPSGNDLYGGGLYVNADATVTLTDVVISGNGSGWGSGMYVAANSDIVLTRVKVVDNIGIDQISVVYAIGGGFYLEDNVTITAEDLLVDGNMSNLGGGFYANEGVHITATGNSIVSDNDGDLEGGGFQLLDGCTVEGFTVTNNTAIAGAGVNANENQTTADTITLTDMTITGNRASIDGGGLWAQGVVDLVGVVLDGNGARYGGNIHILSGAYLSLEGGAVTNGFFTGSLVDGGGAFLMGGTLDSTGVDWGVGTEDNAREDVWLEEAAASTAGVACSFGSNATFVVTDFLGATCPP